MTKLALSLLALDLKLTRAFYERLGFCLSGGDCDSGWMELTKDAVVLQFYTDAPDNTPSAPILSGTIYLQVESIDEFVAALLGHVPVEWGPETMEYGRREIGVRDPSGYLLAFSADR